MTAPNRFTASPAMQQLKADRADTDVDYHVDGAMVGHRLAGGEPEEVDVDLARLVGAGEITTEDAIERIKLDMGITAGRPRHA